jgi:hypothetical protein
VTAILERTAVDVSPATGCRRCPQLRDRFAGWGRLDVFSALGALGRQLPEADRYETNDDAGARAQRLLGVGRARVRATLDFWDDPVDVYSVRLRRGQRLVATVHGPLRAATNLVLWRPGTPTITTAGRFRVAQSRGSLPRRVVLRAAQDGWHYLEVRAARRGSGPYTLVYAKT